MKTKLYLALIALLSFFCGTNAYADVTLSSEPVAAGNVAQSSTNNIVYIVKVDVTGTAVTNTAMQVTLGGTHDATDLSTVKVFTNTTPSLTGATLRNSVSATFAAPQAYNIPIGSFSIAAGSTLYFLVTVDITSNGTGGNTIKVNGATNPVTFTYTTAPVITNLQTDAAAAKTIQVASITISSEPVAASNVSQSSVNNVVYIAKVDVNGVAVTNTAIQVTLGGTHDATDLNTVKVFTNTTPSLTGATLRNSVSAAFAAPNNYNIPIGSFSLAAGSTLYFIVAVDVTSNGTGGNTIKVNGAANPVSFTYTTAPTITNTQTDVAAAKTIQVAGVNISSEPVTAGNVSQSSINNLVYIARVNVTDVAVTNTSMQITLGGTHDATDLSTVKVFTNTTPSLTGATLRNSVSAAFAAPQAYNIPVGSFSIAAGSTLYFLVTVDITSNGTGGNTIKVNGAANPVSFTYTTAPTITNAQTDVANAKTIQVASITLSSEPVAAGNVSQSSINNLVYIAKVDVTDVAVTNTAIQVTLGGTHDATDLSTVKVFTNTMPSLTGATLRNSVSATFAAPNNYNIPIGSFSLAAGSTLYFLVTVDITSNGTGGNTIKVNGLANPVTFTYTTAPTITNTQTDVAAAKTIQVAGVSISSEPVAAGNISQSSTNNIVYVARVDVTDVTVTNTAIQFTLGGTHDATDLSTVKIFTNTTPSLTGATLRNSVSGASAAPHLYNVPIGSFSVAAGSTLYFIIAVDVTSSGTGGNTIKVDGAANPVTFTYTTAPVITNNQTDVAAAKTIQVAGVTISSEPVAAGNMPQSSANNVAYIAKVAVTDVAVTNTAIQFTLSGTHNATDLSIVKVFTNTTPSLTGATLRNSVSAAFAASHLYNVPIGSFSIAAGGTLYFIITVDVTSSGTSGNTVKVNGAANPVTFTYTTAPPVTNIQTDAAGTKTIGSVLPLTLLNFTGTVGVQHVQLNWQTSNEINTKNFEVEWSADGVYFNTVAVISAAGNSSSNKQYNYQHKQPNTGINFYRLKMVDMDGKFTYSPIVKIVVAGGKIKIAAYPNPVTDVLQMQVQAVKNEVIAIGLYDNAGKMVASKTIPLTTGNNQFTWNLRAIAAGNYFIKFGDNSFESVKIVVLK